MENFSDRLTLEGAGGQTDHTRSTFRPPPAKVWGVMVQNRLVASKLCVHEPDTFFWGADKEISEKRNFFVNGSIPEMGKFQRLFKAHEPMLICFGSDILKLWPYILLFVTPHLHLFFGK